MNVQLRRISAETTLCSSRAKTYRFPNVGVIEASAKRSTHWVSFVSARYDGPAEKLTLAAGFQRRESPAFHERPSRPPSVMPPLPSRTTFLRPSVLSIRNTFPMPGVQVRGPPRVCRLFRDPAPAKSWAEKYQKFLNNPSAMRIPPLPTLCPPKSQLANPPAPTRICWKILPGSVKLRPGTTLTLMTSDVPAW